MAHLTNAKLIAFGAFLWLWVVVASNRSEECPAPQQGRCLVQGKAEKSLKGRAQAPEQDAQRPLQLGKPLGVLFVSTHQLQNEDQLVNAVRNACNQLFCELHVVDEPYVPLDEANIAVVMGNTSLSQNPSTRAVALELSQDSPEGVIPVDVEQVLMKLRSLLAKARANTVLDAMRSGQVGV
ncbi:unnamed protein product [Durusdinium trenchii]|uniref:Uncharacterized protein n=2 Tax=Durusdinium trenchii TaxID=1381693 RepID=A0ABP0LZH3_9DINO